MALAERDGRPGWWPATRCSGPPPTSASGPPPPAHPTDRDACTHTYSGQHGAGHRRAAEGPGTADDAPAPARARRGVPARPRDARRRRRRRGRPTAGPACRRRRSTGPSTRWSPSARWATPTSTTGRRPTTWPTTPTTSTSSAGDVAGSTSASARPPSEFEGNVLRSTGFVADVTHMAIHGWCSACARHAVTPGPADHASPTSPVSSRRPFRRLGRLALAPAGPPRRRRGRGRRRRRGGPLRRPDARAAAPRGGPRGGRPLAPRRRDRDRARPAHLAALDHQPARSPAWRPRQSRETLVLSPKGHIEHDLHLVDDGETTWITTEPGRRRAAGDLAGLDAVHAARRGRRRHAPTGPWSASPPAAESLPGRALAWRDPWPDLVGDTAAYGPVEGHPAAGRAWREVLVPRAPSSTAVVGDRALAGTVGQRGAARRGLAAPPRLRDRPPHHRARGRLAAHGRPPAQGLLPRPGDDRPGAQPRPAAAPPGLPAPRRLRAHPPRARRARVCRRRAGRGPAHLGRPATSRTARSRSRWSSAAPTRQVVLVAGGVSAGQEVIVSP